MIKLLIASSVALGVWVMYIWGAVTYYILSYGIPQLEHISFSDRVAYALRWPLAPFATVMIWIVFALGFIKIMSGGKPKTTRPPQGFPVPPKGEEVYKQ